MPNTRNKAATAKRHAVARAVAWILPLALLAACGNRPDSAAQPAQPSEESFKEFGNYELHYNAVRADGIAQEIARAHGIERSKNSVLLNVTMLRKEADHTPRKPVKGTVSVDAYNLNGQLKNLEMRQVTEGDAVYYLGQTGISGNEILVFDIKAQPEGEAATLTAKFKREFVAE